MFWGMIKQVLRRPLGLAADSVLVLLYLSAILADFLSPYQTNLQDLERTYHPPTGLFFADGGLQVQAYEFVDPSEARYEAIDGQGYPV